MLKVYPKLFKAAIVGFIALASVITAKSQSLFTGLNGPYGGFVNDLIAHTGGNLIAATSQGGLYYSTDGGANWTKTSTTDVSLQDLEMDGTGKLYALASARIYTSDDAGLNWTIHTNTGQFNGGKRIKKAPNGNLYVATFGQVFKSTTPGGAIFTATTLSTGSITDMEVNSLNDIVVSTNGSGIYYSNNNGSNWSPPATPPVSSSSYSIVSSGDTFYVLAGDAPYKSTDRGDTWTSIKSTITESIFSGVLKFDGGGNLYLFNSAYSKFYSTTDQGVNWSAGTSYPIFLGSQAALAQSSTTVFLALANYGIQKTTDGGTIWTDAHSGIKNFTPTDIFLTPNGRLLMGYSGRGFYLSIDDGQTWTFKNSGAGNTAIPINVFAKLSDNSILAGGSGVIRSTDNGTNWTLQHGSETIQQLVTADGVNLYGMQNFSFNIKSSVDQGVTWTPMLITGFSGTANYAAKVVIDAAGNLYFRVLDTGVYQIYKVPSSTTVASLLTVPGITTVQDIYAQGNNIYVLGNAGAVYTVSKSIDGGSNWDSKSCLASTGFWAFDDSNLFLQPTTTGSIQISHDGGTTWSNQNLLDVTARAVDLLISPGYYAYLATTSSVTHKSTNIIIPPEPPTNLAQFGISYNQVYFKFDDNSNNEEYFIIEQSIGDNLNYDSLDWVDAFTNPQGYTWYNPFIEPGTTYYYRVRAANDAGKSAYTNEISVTTPAQCVPTIPDNRSWSGTAVADAGSTPSGPGPFTGTNVTINRIVGSSNNYTISNYAYGVVPPAIHPNPGTVTFIENCGSTFMPLSQFDFANGNGTWDPNAGNGTLILKWQTNPDDLFFQGTTTLILNLTDPAPATPTLNPYIYSGTEVFLNWSQSSFATQYKIFRSDAGAGGPYNLVTTVNYPKLFHIDKNLTGGLTYYYKISALNGTGESAQSGQISILLGPTLFRPVENDIQLNTENQQGVSWGDLDGDGDEDIASPSFTNNAGESVPPVFFENTGGGQFARRDLSILSDENTGISRGIALFDFNNDAKLDMYIIRNANDLPDLLLINNGNWDFTKTAITESKIATGLGFRGLGIIDYDNDGFADVYVGNDNGGLPPPTLSNFLFRNNGGTSLTKILTGEAVTDTNNSRTVSLADYDNDGDQDLFVLNWSNNASTANRLYRNNGDGTFTKVTGLVFDTDLFITARTVSWGDIDNDSDLDLYVGAQSTGAPAYDRLYRNDGDGTFTSLTSSAVAEVGSITFGSSMGDIDNDGDLDLIAINSGANSIFINNGSGTFTKSPSLELFTNPNIFEIGGAMADFDQDGFLDIYPAKGQTGVVDLPNQLYKNTNTASASKNWIEVRLVGTASNKSAIGARVKAVTNSPARTQIREVTALTGYGSQNSLVQHFGLGTATIVNQLEIKWPSGAIMTLNNLAVNQVHSITEDFAGPAFATLAPANGATNVAATTSLALTLDEPFAAIAGKKLRVYKSPDLVNAVYTLDMSAGVISTNTISFTLLPRLDQSTSYVATLEAGAFSDTYSNLSAAIAASEWSFMTDPGPQVTLFNPTVGATNVSAATKIEITYDRSTTGAAGKNIKLFKSTDLINAIATLDVSTGTVTGNKISFTPPQKLEQNVNYVVTLDAAAFADGVGNISAEIAASTWNFTTDPGPQVTTLSPANNSTGVAISTNIGLTFNTTVTGVAGKKVNISLASNPGTPVQQIDVGTASIPGSTVSFTLVSPLILFTNYVVTVDGGAFADANGNVTAAISSGWAFKTRDNTPPTITFTPDATLNKGFNSKVFSVTATDGETGISSVTMYHRGVTATNFTPLPGVLNAGKYDFTVA